MNPYPKKHSSMSAKTYREEYLSNTRKKAKYNNVKQQYNGRMYDSKLEAKFAQELDYRKEAGEIKEIIPQYKIELRGLTGQRVCRYYVDFKVINADNSVTYYEVKGAVTFLWKLKWELTLQQLAIDEPGAELIIIK